MTMADFSSRGTRESYGQPADWYVGYTQHCHLGLVAHRDMNCSQSNSFVGVQLQPTDRTDRRHAAYTAPCTELGHVNTTIACLTVVNPGLRPLQLLADLPLGKTCFLPHLAEEPRDRHIVRMMLSFGGHGPNGIVQGRVLDTSCVSEQNETMMQAQPGAGIASNTLHEGKIAQAVWNPDRVRTPRLYWAGRIGTSVPGRGRLASSHRPGRFGHRSTPIRHPWRDCRGADLELLPLAPYRSLPCLDWCDTAGLGRQAPGKTASQLRLSRGTALSLLPICRQHAARTPGSLRLEPLPWNFALPECQHRFRNGSFDAGALRRVPRCAGEVLLPNRSVDR